MTLLGPCPCAVIGGGAAAAANWRSVGDGGAACGDRDHLRRRLRSRAGLALLGTAPTGLLAYRHRLPGAGGRDGYVPMIASDRGASGFMGVVHSAYIGGLDRNRQTQGRGTRRWSSLLLPSLIGGSSCSARRYRDVAAMSDCGI